MVKKVLLSVFFSLQVVPCWAVEPISTTMAILSVLKLAKKYKEGSQLDRMEYRQAKGLRRIGDTLQKAAAIKREIESISQDIQRSQEQARRFREGLKKHKGKMGLVFFEQQIGMPLDPGYYVPSTPLTREWKRKARIKLGGARAAWGDCPLFEQTSRQVMKAMAEGGALDDRALGQAAHNDLLLEEARQENEAVQIKMDVERAQVLAKQIEELKALRVAKKLSVTELMAVEGNLTTKEMALRRIQRDIFAASARAARAKRSDHDKVFDRYAQRYREGLAEVIRQQEGR